MIELKISYARIRRKAEELLDGQVGPPVDLERITANLGAELRRMDLEPDISGMLYRDGDRKVIVLNQRHSAARARFTWAHEIAHLALHKGEAVHVDQSFRINLRDPRSAAADDVEEIEANALAANLLMPAAWLRTDIAGETLDLEDDAEVAALAERYQVSVPAMINRLTSLLRT